MQDDPWAGITGPGTADAITARRVDPALPWHFFWGRGADQKLLFVLQHAPESSPSGKLPNLRGIDLSLIDRSVDGQKILIFRLQDASQRDLFQNLCRDIVQVTGDARSERDAVAACLARTWRWHHLLRGGTDARLSGEEQKGLIGELILLRQFMSCLPAPDALDAWKGPLGAPKDFDCARICAEAKARAGAAAPRVFISSTSQLDDAGCDALFLFAVEIDQAPAGTPESFTLTDLATQIRSELSLMDGGTPGTFDVLLSAAGFRWTDDYSDTAWMRGADGMYRVGDAFPRITPAMVPPGVDDVRYTVSLPECGSFLVEPNTLINIIESRLHVLRT